MRNVHISMFSSPDWRYASWRVSPTARLYMVTRWREWRRNWARLIGNYCYFCRVIGVSSVSLDLAGDIERAQFYGKPSSRYGSLRLSHALAGIGDDDWSPGDA